MKEESKGSSTSPLLGDYEGRIKRPKGNDYDVFLSFSGKDTRKGFTDHLYYRLVEAKICVFRDDNKLPIGKEIGPELLCSIRQSKISIPIISTNYAFSKWCLRELAQMLKCKRSGGQIVLPIFYKVNPSHVRHLTRRFGDAIKAHKENIDEKVLKEWKKALKEVKEWEDALQEVGSLKGWESKKNENGYEGALVEIIVKCVLNELRRTSQIIVPQQLVGIDDHIDLKDLKRTFQLIVPQQLVGIDDSIEHIMSFIDAKFNGTWIIGIYGMGGIGKTTLAKALYNKLFSQFEYHSFVADYRETLQCKGIACLQRQLLSGLGSSCDVSSVDEGTNLIKSQFAHKKALIFLDDIGDNAQLKYLVDRAWFEAGSIIIITTRDKSTLNKIRADQMYELPELSRDKSLILFSRHAFQLDFPPSDYKALTHDVVSTTGGLPLALEVIGSLLYEKKIEVWQDIFKKLKKGPNKTVQEKLKISYDPLEEDEKQIFLDIACFFIGSNKQNPIYMWDACDFYPWWVIDRLSHMSLIKIRENDNLWMHDQLRDFGREVVRLENPEPQECSRLWIHAEAQYVLENNKGTKKIEVLSLGKCSKGKRYAAEQFKELTNLRFLQVDGANFTGDFQSLLPKLRWLQWKECPSDFAAVNFHLKKLVVLDLSNSAISEDWGGWDPLKKVIELKVLNLIDCQSLKRTPNLSTFKRLEILSLGCCLNLEELHPSVGNLASLIELHLTRTLITKLPESIGNLQNLRILCILGTSITELPDAIGMLTKLQKLKASNCRNLERLPSNICKLIALEELHVSSCKKLQELPELPSGLTKLWITCQGQSLPHLSQLTSLKTLFLQDCHRLECVPKLPIGLSVLYIDCCGKLKALTNLSDLKHLRYFHIFESPSLNESPDVLNFRRTQRELGLKETQLCLDQSLILFSRHEFQNESPPSDYEDISCDVVSTTGGLPLALVLLRSFSCRMLDSLCRDWSKDSMKVSHEEVREKLKMSYEALDYEKQQTFLDIARLFIGKRNPTYMWDACDFSPGMGIEVLNLMSFIKIDEDGELLMHDQLRDLGREIVYLENPREPQERSRLWICEEALDVLDNCKGTKKIEALSLVICGEGRRYAAKQFKELTNLGFLQADGVDFTGDFQSLLPELRWFKWNGYPSNFVANNFHPKKLVVLDLSDSAISEDWGGWDPLKMATELKVLNLMDCESLKRTPDLSTFRRLEILTFANCYYLEELHSSIGNLASLIELDLSETSITELPESIGNLQNLRVLNICDTCLTELPDAIGMLAKLQKLEADDCINLERKLISLEELYLDCQLPELPSSLTLLSITFWEQSLPNLSQLTRLKILHLYDFRWLGCVPELPIGLSELHITKCGKLKALTNLSDLKNLRHFSICECPSLEGSPDESNFRRTQMRELGLEEY